MITGWAIHRHTGGLESQAHLKTVWQHIHRHTGGLEIDEAKAELDKNIHRHTGGLENSTS